MRRTYLGGLTTRSQPGSGLKSICWRQKTRPGLGAGTRLVSHRPSDPLRVLFCGSDEFSCASLDALHKERLRDRSSIESIDVVVRPAKHTGRGLKTVREVPLETLAQQLKLPLHTKDTFTGWTPPASINIIVAVSFGLFVPKRLLRAVKYGGLNVHPSMLPDLRGPAPIHHALLLARTHTGITLQTLDENAFDNGVVLAQTPAPGVPIPRDSGVTELLETLAPLGADVLVQGLRRGVHVPPLTDVAWTPSHAPAHAPKLSTADRRVDWASWMGDDILRRRAVLGPLWGEAVTRKAGVDTTTRLIMDDLDTISLAQGGDMEFEKMGAIEWKSPVGAETVVTAVLVPTTTKPNVKRTWARSVVIQLLSEPEAGIRLGMVKMEGKTFAPARAALAAFLT